MRTDAVLQAHRPLVITAAAVLPFAACAVLSVFRDSIANTNAALGLVLLVVAAASMGIRLAGLVAALSSAAWFDFFLTQPYNTFAIKDVGDIETAVLLVLVGIAVSELALWGRRQQARASREQGYLSGVVSAAETAAAGLSSTRSFIARVADQIVEVLQIDDCRFDPSTGSGDGVASDATVPVLHGDGTITRNGRPVEVSRLGLPTDSEIMLPVQSGGVVHGRFLLISTSEVVRPSSEQLKVAVTLANQAGAALAASK